MRHFLDNEMMMIKGKIVKVYRQDPRLQGRAPGFRRGEVTG